MVGDNAPPLEEWKLPARCCGTWASDAYCTICGNWVRELPERFELGIN